MLLENAFCPTCQATYFRHHTVHIHRRKADKDFIWRLFSINNLPAPRQDNDPSVRAMIFHSPDELGLLGGRTRYIPPVVGTKVEPGCDVNIGSKPKMKRGFRVPYSFLRLEPSKMSFNPCIVNPGDRLMNVQGSGQDKFCRYTACALVH